MEPVTVGVPLPDRYPEARFGLSSPAGQFRVLGRYPSGNVKWVLCDFQADRNSTVTLTDGSGNYGGSDLATDSGSTIAVDTGAAQFRIRKANFNVFDRVTVGGAVIVSAQTGELSLYAADTDEKYSSANDANSTAVLEENGPARCCIRATGSFKNAAGVRLADFTLRLHFYKGKSYVRGIYTLRTDTTTPIGPLFFHACEATVPLSISNATATFATKTSTVAQTIGAGQTATLFQAFSTRFEVEGGPESPPSMYWEPPMLAAGSPRLTYAQQGLEIVAAGTTLNALSNATDYTQGFADLSGANGVGCTVALRWMGAYWPSGFDFGGDGRLTVEIYSKRNSKKNLKLRALKTEWREIGWEFHATAATASDMQATLARIETPLMARAPLDQYASTGAVFGQQDFVTGAEQAAIYAALGQSATFSEKIFNAPVTPSIYRWWGWESPGGTNQIDVALNEFVEFLRGGPVSRYHRGYARVFFNATQTQSMQPGQELAAYNENANDPDPYRGCINGAWFQSEHFHSPSIPMLYWLTGDEGLFDATINLRRWWQQSATRGFDDARSLFFRGWLRRFRNVAFLYEFALLTGRDKAALPAMLTYLKRASDFILDSADVPGDIASTSGRNRARGYYYNCDWVVLSGRKEHGRPVFGLVDMQIGCDAFHHGRRVLQQYAGGYRDDEFEDFLEGLGRFYMAEMYDNTSVSPKRGLDTDIGTLYGYSIDYPYPAPIDNATVVGAPYNQTLYLWPFDFSRSALLAYRATGDASYLQKAIPVVWGADHFQNGLNSRELQDQSLMAATLRPPQKWQPLPVTVSGGVVTWNAPASAKVRVKTSQKNIVDWLGYDRTTCTFAVDPATNVPYFAAQTVVGAVSGMAAASGAHYAARMMI